MGDGERLVLRRALSERALAFAACATSLFATTVLVVLLAYTGSVTDEGLRRTLATSTFESAGSRISAHVTAGDYAQTERSLRTALDRAYGEIPATLTLTARGDSYVLPGQERLEHPELTTFAAYSGIERHATLTAGTWPRPAPPTGTAEAGTAEAGTAEAGTAEAGTGGTGGQGTGAGTAGDIVEAALPTAAARAMKVEAGGILTLHSRVDGSAVRVKVTGLFQVDRPEDYVWQGGRLVTTGVERLDYTTYGPLVVPPATFAGRFAGTGFAARWLVFPQLQAVSPGELGELDRRLDTLVTELRTGRTGPGFIVDTDLPALLAQVDGALLVARSTMLIPVLQLAVLAAYALLLVARLIAEHRQMEVALLRARGAAAGQLSGLTLGEGVLLTAPGAITAPLLVPPLLDLAGRIPAIRASGLTLDASPSVLTWIVSIGAALACGLALTLPTLRGVTRPYVAGSTGRGRGERRGALQRAGADLALLVVAGLGVWQLSRYGGPVTATTTAMETGPATAAAGVDPFIVAGPALALLAGGTLVLRLVPVASQAVERLTSRGRGLAPVLGARQVSRRPLRHARPALLLVMAVAVGVLSVATEATWSRSQLDQADFQAGTDLRVAAPAEPAGPLALGQGGRLAGLPGVTSLSPVLRRPVTAGDQDVTLIAGDAAVLGSLLRARPDAMDRSTPARLTAGRPRTSPPVPPAPPVPQAFPGRPGRIAFDLRLAPRDAGTAPTTDTVFQVFATVVDGLGVTHELDLGDVPSDGRARPHTVATAELAGPGGRITFPLVLRSVRYQFAEDPRRPAVELSVLRIRGVDAGGGEPRAAPGESGVRGALPAGAGTPLPAPAADAWYAFPADPPGTGAVGGSGGGGGGAPEIRHRPGTFVTMVVPEAVDDGPQSRIRSKSRSTTGGAVIAAPADRAVPGTGTVLAPIPGIITAELAQRARVGLGGTVTVGGSADAQPIRVTGVVPALPSTAPDRPAVLVDLPTLTERLLTAGRPVPEPDEWWLAVRGGDTAPAARALAAHPGWTGEIVDRMALRRDLRDAPLGAALQGALLIGFLAALAFAMIGFAVNATVSVRERAGEFAILRALGAGPRQVFGMLGVEQAFLGALGLIGGTALGLAVAYLVIPHIVLTIRAGAPYPPVDMVISWRPILGLLGGVIVLLVAALTLLVRALRRTGLGGTGRIGADG